MIMLKILSLPCLYVLTNASPFIQTHLIKSLLAGIMGLVNSRRLLISGTRWCGKRQGVLHQESFNIKRSAESRYKYAVCRLKRRQRFLLNKKLACSFSRKRKDRFWSDIRRLNNSSTSCFVSVLDGISGRRNNANMLVSKFGGRLNKNSSQDTLDVSIQI